MATDITVVLEDRPGTLAELGEALGRSGINIMGGCGVSSSGVGVVHILVEDPAATRRALQDAGIKVHGEREVLVEKIADQPGELGKLTRRLADADVNLDLLYLDTEGQVVLGVDDLDKAREAL